MQKKIQQKLEIEKLKIQQQIKEQEIKAKYLMNLLKKIIIY